MKRELQGRYVIISTVGEKAEAFVPAPLPPRPPIDWTPELRSKFDQALMASSLVLFGGFLLRIYVLKAGMFQFPW